MSAGLNSALCARWDAKNLDAVIPGGLSRGSAPEGLAAGVAYATYMDVTSAKVSASKSSRYIRCSIQIDNYAYNDADADAGAVAIREALTNADRAAANAMTMGQTTGTIVSIEPDGDPIASEESRDVWRVTQTFAVVYSESRNLAPAS